MSSITVHVAAEGITDEIVIRRILRHTQLLCGYVRVNNGKANLLKNIEKYNAAARFANWLVILDLDRDADCAPTFIQTVMPSASQGMLLRIPVRAMESWLMADRERLAGYLGISVENIPQNPDLEENPKVTLIGLARRSNKTALREDIVPRPNSGNKVGPGYSGRIQEFVEGSKSIWRPEIAMENSDSLRRCINALQNWNFIQ